MCACVNVCVCVRNLSRTYSPSIHLCDEDVTASWSIISWQNDSSGQIFYDIDVTYIVVACIKKKRKQKEEKKTIQHRERAWYLQYIIYIDLHL